MHLSTNVFRKLRLLPADGKNVSWCQRLTQSKFSFDDTQQMVRDGSKGKCPAIQLLLLMIIQRFQSLLKPQNETNNERRKTIF